MLIQFWVQMRSFILFHQIGLKRTQESYTGFIFYFTFFSFPCIIWEPQVYKNQLGGSPNFQSKACKKCHRLQWPLERRENCQQHYPLGTALHPGCQTCQAHAQLGPSKVPAALKPPRPDWYRGPSFPDPQPHISFQSQISPQKSDWFPFQSLELKTTTTKKS